MRKCLDIGIHLSKGLSSKGFRRIERLGCGDLMSNKIFGYLYKIMRENKLVLSSRYNKLGSIYRLDDISFISKPLYYKSFEDETATGSKQILDKERKKRFKL